MIARGSSASEAGVHWLWPWLWLGVLRSLVRPAAMADCPRMAAIHAEGFALGWDWVEFERMLLADHVADVMISRAPFGEIVTGFAISRVVLDEAELLSVALDPEVRGRSLSAPLLQQHAARVRRAGVKRLFLEVASDNAPALALYRGLGFVEIGRRAGYYPPRAPEQPGDPALRRDALTMRWDIGHLDPAPRW